jgi:hypothetical protein
LVTVHVSFSLSLSLSLFYILFARVLARAETRYDRKSKCAHFFCGECISAMRMRAVLSLLRTGGEMFSSVMTMDCSSRRSTLEQMEAAQSSAWHAVRRTDEQRAISDEAQSATTNGPNQIRSESRERGLRSKNATSRARKTITLFAHVVKGSTWVNVAHGPFNSQYLGQRCVVAYVHENTQLRNKIDNFKVSIFAHFSRNCLLKPLFV